MKLIFIFSFLIPYVLGFMDEKIHSITLQNLSEPPRPALFSLLPI